MNLFLDEKYKYVLLEEIHNARSRLNSMLQTPWYDITVNLAGRVFDDNTFKIYPKFSMGIEVFGIVQSMAVLTGKMEAEGEQTNMVVEVRPNNIVLLALYLILLIFFYKLFILLTSSTGRDWILAVTLFFILIFTRILIHFSMGRLKNRFERIMSLHPEE
jgi:hypothetical protein